MPSTRTPGITVDAHGQRTINKEYRGERIFLRLGSLAQEDAEGRLLVEIDRLESEIERRRHARPLFSDCAKRFLPSRSTRAQNTTTSGRPFVTHHLACPHELVAEATVTPPQCGSAAISEILQFPVIVERRRPLSPNLNRFKNSISS